MYSPPTLDEVFQQIPEEVRQYITTSCDTGGKDAGELHNVLMYVRTKFKLPPWSNTTMYFKLLAKPVVHGRNFELANVWAVKGYDKVIHKIATNQKAYWVNLKITIAHGDKKASPFLVAVHPGAHLIWSYSTESLAKRWIRHDSKTTTTVPERWLLDTAASYISKGYKNGAIVEVTYEVNMSRSSKAKERCDSLYQARMNKIASELSGLEPDEKPVKEPTTEVTKQETPKSVLKPIEVKSVIFAEDAEMFLTMFDLAKQKLLEMGCEETVIRWKKKLDKLLGKESNE